MVITQWLAGDSVRCKGGDVEWKIVILQRKLTLKMVGMNSVVCFVCLMDMVEKRWLNLLKIDLLKFSRIILHSSPKIMEKHSKTRSTNSTKKSKTKNLVQTQGLLHALSL